MSNVLLLCHPQPPWASRQLTCRGGAPKGVAALTRERPVGAPSPRSQQRLPHLRSRGQGLDLVLHVRRVEGGLEVRCPHPQLGHPALHRRLRQPRLRLLLPGRQSLVQVGQVTGRRLGGWSPPSHSWVAHGSLLRGAQLLRWLLVAHHGTGSLLRVQHGRLGLLARRRCLGLDRRRRGLTRGLLMRLPGALLPLADCLASCRADGGSCNRSAVVHRLLTGRGRRGLTRPCRGCLGSRRRLLLRLLPRRRRRLLQRPRAGSSCARSLSSRPVLLPSPGPCRLLSRGLLGGALLVPPAAGRPAPLLLGGGWHRGCALPRPGPPPLLPGHLLEGGTPVLSTPRLSPAAGLARLPCALSCAPGRPLLARGLRAGGGAFAWGGTSSASLAATLGGRCDGRLPSACTAPLLLSAARRLCWYLIPVCRGAQSLAELVSSAALGGCDKHLQGRLTMTCGHA